jgi:hypothetical protein
MILFLSEKYIKIVDIINNRNPIINTLSFPIRSDNIPEGIPIIVWVMLIIVYIIGMKLCSTPKSEDFKSTKE